MKPFDLRAFLCGAPAVTRGGNKVNIVYVNLDDRRLLVTTDTNITFTVTMGGHVLGGTYIQTSKHENDLVGMWKEPPKFEHWQLLDVDIKYIAKNIYGAWFGYPAMPRIYGEDKRWIYTGKSRSAKLLSGVIACDAFPECDWENSLIERPKDE